MLFNSHVFIFLYLPFLLTGYFVLRKLTVSDRLPLLWLLFLSLFFYGWWEARYLVLLVTSIVINFNAGKLISRAASKRWWLALGVGFNLVLLAYFKYAWFIVDNLGGALGQNWSVEEITLPLAISFFTFQQIAWLVDISRSRAGIPRFYNYALFVSFFPQLIAGPIVHHAEMMPQFERRPARPRILDNLNVGLTLFTLGLFKKIVLADQFALYASPVFDAAGRGEVVTMLEAWVGTMAYTLQLYFDFSGYSDMAVGLARMLGIVLPLNFFSPYKATNIRQFWQRWHITLSRFLRDYLYIPLGGNRASAARVSVNIFATMLIGGLWHGAAWTFVAWGGLHGLYLLVHRGYASWRGDHRPRSAVHQVAGIACTFLAVTIAWVLFRAESFTAALVMYKGMLGLSGLTLPADLFASMPATGAALQAAGLSVANLPYLQGLPEIMWLAAGCAICLFAPNAYEFMAGREPALIPANIQLHPSRIQWRDSYAWAVFFAVLFTWSILALNRVSEFLYFQF
jgi:D-alanyl-lipoteichoic acid acyltransferase DltB (MBOAT superfamily)